jgi:hypothetical protein
MPRVIQSDDSTVFEVTNYFDYETLERKVKIEVRIYMTRRQIREYGGMRAVDILMENALPDLMGFERGWQDFKRSTAGARVVGGHAKNTRTGEIDYFGRSAGRFGAYEIHEVYPRAYVWTGSLKKVLEHPPPRYMFEPEGED